MNTCPLCSAAPPWRDELRAIQVDGKLVRLSGNEFLLLALLRATPGKLVKADTMRETLNPLGLTRKTPDDKLVVSAIVTLRKKLVGTGFDIWNSYGAGYALVAAKEMGPS